VISANLLCSPFGSSSPYSVDPLGRPLRTKFPPVTVTDCARAMASLVRTLNLKRLRAAVGVSLGGMIALRLATLFPEIVPATVAVSAPLVLPESIRGQLGLTRQALASDASFRDGEYNNGVEVAGALKRVRMTALRDLYPRDQLARVHGSAFAAERALGDEAELFSQRFDANCYAALCQCAAACDMTDGLIQEFPGRALLIGCSSDDFAPASRVREAYHALTAVGARATYWELNSDAGHRAHYLDAERLNAPIREFLRSR
jgi:homoserine O-acetyltransferase